jgi:AraC family transcriptional regulator of adaptative response / DNA-3-methyladenine glycosylase II
MQLLDSDQFYRALIARDTRFDGVFFVGVTSTGVYCRPVCRAPKPRPHRCRYFSIAAAAERHGFRPCLRCRPELAPGDAHGSAARDGATIDAVARLAARPRAASRQARSTAGGSTISLRSSASPHGISGAPSSVSSV